MEPILCGDHVNRVLSHYSLLELVGKGSSTDLYAYKPGWLARLTYDAGSHNLAVQGAAKGYRFPAVLKNYGCVGISDDYPDDRYWLGVFEQCRPIGKQDVFYEKFCLFINAFESNNVEYSNALMVIESHSTFLEDCCLMETLQYSISFAQTYGLDLDMDINNFMVNPQGHLVAIDIVYGTDPSPWCENHIFD